MLVTGIQGPRPFLRFFVVIALVVEFLTDAVRCGMNLSVLTRNKALKAFFPYHDEERRRELYAMWIKPCASPNSQPLDEIKVRNAFFVFVRSS